MLDGGCDAYARAAAGAALAEELCRFSNDWTDDGMVVEAFADPKVALVTFHLVRFDRSVIDRLTKRCERQDGAGNGAALWRRCERERGEAVRSCRSS
jgi:catabolite regulation protein CreA